MARLTADAYDRAKACGRTGPQCAADPYEICPSEAGRYVVRLATPFSRVAVSVYEGLKSGSGGRTMDRASADRWGTGLYVLPAQESPSAAGIDRVEIRRDNRTIMPLTRTVGPVVVRMGDGRSMQLSRGYFTFAADALAPTGDVAIVFFGSQGESTCTVSREQLERLQ